MSEKNTAVFGIYPTHQSADDAVDTLRTKGFRSTDISVLFPQNVGSKEFGHEKGTKSAEVLSPAAELAPHRRRVGVAGRHRHARHSGRRAFHRRGTHRRDPRRHGRWRERSAARPARSSDWVSRSTRRSGTRGG
jgi:hypothetical protein